MPEDHDQLFEKALARHLRAEPASEALCLDAETLGAYHERALSAEELSAAKSHIVSCARCQEILAQLESTETVAAAKVTPISVRKSSLLRWAAPAGAVAAGLLLLVGLREFRKPAREAAQSAQVAENRPQAPTDDFHVAESKGPAKKKAQAESQSALQQLQAPSAPALRDEEKDSLIARNLPAPAKPVSPRQYSRRTAIPPMAGPSAAAGQAQAADSLQRGDAPRIPAASQHVEVAEAPALEAARAQDSKSAAVGGTPAATPALAPPPPPPAPSAKKTQTEAAEATAQSELVAHAEVSGKAAAYSLANSRIGHDIRIAAPGGKKIWSTGPNGTVAFSGDAGRSWAFQSSGVTTNLTSGSAPSDKVCWIAGAAGTLLRTTDGGKHWQAIHTPIASDLGGVRATDAQHASIWDVAKRVSYETSDAGVTWKQTGNE